MKTTWMTVAMVWLCVGQSMSHAADGHYNVRVEPGGSIAQALADAPARSRGTVTVGAGNHYIATNLTSLLKNEITLHFEPGARMLTGNAADTTPRTLFNDFSGAVTSSITGFGQFYMTNPAGAILVLTNPSSRVFVEVVATSAATNYLVANGAVVTSRSVDSVNGSVSYDELKADYYRGPNTNAVDVIIDTDIGGGDVDDFLDLWMAHRMMDRGELNVLAVMNSVTNGYGAPVAELVNRWFGRGAIPIGQNKTNAPGGTTGYTLGMSTNFPNSLRDGTNALDARVLYPMILGTRPNRSVKLIVTGPLTQVRDLWYANSNLMIQKISEIIIVAGSYPSSVSDFNFAAAPQACVDFLYRNRTIPVTYVGITNVGDTVSTATGYATRSPRNSPIHDAMVRYGTANRPGWAQMGLWYAARGTNFQGTNYFDRVSAGTNVVISGAGDNLWTGTDVLNESYLVRTGNTNTFMSMINDMLFSYFPVRYGRAANGNQILQVGGDPLPGSFDADAIFTRTGRSSGVAAFSGSSFASHFLFGAGEDTYIRGGAASSRLFLNDSATLGTVVVGAAGFEMTSGGPKILIGTGTPEGVVTAPVGSLFLRTDAATSLYVKQTGTGNTGWVAK